MTDRWLWPMIGLVIILVVGFVGAYALSIWLSDKDK